LRVPSVEKQIGIEAFISKTQGIGGRIRQRPEDFLVEEILVNGSRAETTQKPAPSQISGEGRYLICLLVKRNRDTLLTARRIARQLGISERRVQIAGIKDKRAVTSQHISIENIKLTKLGRIQTDDFKVHPLRYSPNMVFPHMLLGNAFRITIRSISRSFKFIQEKTSETMQELRVRGGVPNFFGHQRFGTIRPITHLVGKALAENDIEEAALLFLARPSLYEHPRSREVRQQLLETGDFNAAFKNFPGRLVYERLMLSHLARHPKEYAKAFRRLPKRLCRLFLQAYQSYLFNRFLSQRILQGIPIDEPQNGDYVVKTDRHGLPTNSYVKTSPDRLDSLRTAVKKGEMYIALPLIGFRQPPSEGVQGEIEQRILEAEQVGQASFQVPSMREMSSAGELRAILSPLASVTVEKPSKDELNPRRKKLEMSFALHRGRYATVVLREFMKVRNLIKAGY
jgi:tRNA pseudouridine13 synthase